MTVAPKIITTRVKPSKPQYDIISSRQQVNLFLSGQGGGKTECAGVVSGQLISKFPKASGFIGANTYVQLSDSTLKRIRTVWKEKFGWTEWSKDNPRGSYVVDKQPPAHFDTTDHEFDTYRGKICFKNGTVVFKGSLDNYMAHDGKEFGWAVLDETKDTKEEAVKEVITGRLREKGMYVNENGELVSPADIEKHNKEHKDNPEKWWSAEDFEAWNPLFIFTSPAKVQWINQWFDLDDYVQEITTSIYSDVTYFKKDIKNKRVVICSTLHNLKNLPSNYIENQMANLHSSLQDMLIYGNPFSASGGEFYKCFNRVRNVKDISKVEGFNYGGGRAYNPELALHFSFDFNVNPFMTCTVWQIVIEKGADKMPTGKKFVYQIDEVCLSNPVNTTNDVCKELVRRYHGHTAGVFVYGDPSGRHEDTRTEKGHNDFIVIVRGLKDFKPNQRIPSAAPPVVMRGNWINTIFEKGHEGIEVWIHQKCPKSIDDYVYLKEDSDGTKKKEKVKNPDTQVTYEKFGHTSDSGDYFLCVAFASEFARYMKGGVASGKPSSGKSAGSKSSY